MTKLQPPPAYNSRGGHGPPSTYTVPTRFQIGASNTDTSLVRIPEIKGHLALLRMFAELKNKVVELGPGSAPYVPVDAEKRWSWFVALAVERFDIWCRALTPEDAKKTFEEIMPPLDVIMVWHAYMLNPRWYAEDCLRIPSCAILKDLGPHLNEALLQFNGTLSDLHNPSRLRVEFWRTKTALPFEALASVRMMTKKVILCPQCRTQIQVDLMDADGQGYLQKKFSAYCPTPFCSVGGVTKEKLAVRKLAEDIVGSLRDQALDIFP